ILSWASNSFLETPELTRISRMLGSSSYSPDSWASLGYALREQGMAIQEGVWLALTQAVTVASGRDPVAARAVGAIAAGVLRNSLDSQPPDWSSWNATIAWLLHLSGDTAVSDIGRGIGSVLSRGPLDPERAWLNTVMPTAADTQSPSPAAPSLPASQADTRTIPPVQPAPYGLTGPAGGNARQKAVLTASTMQAGIVFWAYAPAENVAEWLILSPSEKRMLKAAGSWVFDGGRLQQEQWDTVLDILRAWRPGKFGICAVFLGQAPDPSIRYPVYAAGGMNEPAAALMIPWLPPDATRPPRELWPGIVLPPQPEQVAACVRECARTIQFREFQRRPHIRFRRDALLTLSRNVDNGLFPFLGSLGWSGDPDDLFPALAVAWTGGCDSLFTAAAAYQQQGRDGPMAILLQMADLLSMGGDTAPLMVYGLNQSLLRQDAALKRAMLSPERPYPTGISWGSEIFGYDGSALEQLF
ncbi:MAG TPA: hypothetical protein PLO53_11880, partial [Candidatus Hydrogenedentes bacterium]|nr:hypothetical protein [Candidatus Hydrogenedentota bacterium]